MKIPPKLIQLQQLHNDMASMLALLYSPEGLQVFSEMAKENFTISWSKLTPEEAHTLLFFLAIAEQIQVVSQYQPESLTLIPKIAFDGFSNALRQLTPYRELLQKIEAKLLTPFEVKILAGELDIANGRGISFTLEELNDLVNNAA